MNEDDFLIELFNSDQNNITKYSIQNQKHVSKGYNIPSNTIASSNIIQNRTSSLYDHIFINEDGEITDYFLELIKKDQPDLLLNENLNSNNESIIINKNDVISHTTATSYARTPPPPNNNNLNKKTNINNNTNANNTSDISNSNVGQVELQHSNKMINKLDEYSEENAKKKKDINTKTKKNLKIQEQSPNFMLAKNQSVVNKYLISHYSNNNNSSNTTNNNNETELDNKIKSFELRIKGHLLTIKSLALQVQESQSIINRKNKEIHDLEMKLKPGTVIENIDSTGSNCHSPHIINTQGVHIQDDQLKILQVTVHKSEELNLQHKEQIKFLQHKCNEETSRRQRAEERSRVLKNFSDKSKERCISLQTHNDELKQALHEITNRMDKNKKTIKDLQYEKNLYKISSEELQQDLEKTKLVNEKSNHIIKQLQISLENSRNDLYQQNKENTQINSKNKQLLLENSMIQEKYNLNRTKQDRFQHMKDFNNISFKDRSDKKVEVFSLSDKNPTFKSFQDNELSFYKNNQRPPLNTTNKISNSSNNNDVTAIIDIHDNVNNYSDTEMIKERRKTEQSFSPISISKDDIYINTKSNKNTSSIIQFIHQSHNINTIESVKIATNTDSNNDNHSNNSITNDSNSIKTINEDYIATKKSKITLSFIKQKAIENGCNPGMIQNNCRQHEIINKENTQIENPSMIKNHINLELKDLFTSNNIKKDDTMKIEVEISKDISRLKSLYDKVVIHKK